jgi:hypothetical protein
LFGRRWKYVYDQLQKGYSVLLTDVDNVFLRYHPLQNFDESEYDVFHAYSTSYPTHVFEQMGFTVCGGGMSWLRADPKVIRFVASLVNKCKCLKDENDDDFCKNCYCDDQVALNELLWKGKHSVTWDRTFEKPKSLKDYPWRIVTRISSTTRHHIKVVSQVCLSSTASQKIPRGQLGGHASQSQSKCRHPSVGGSMFFQEKPNHNILIIELDVQNGRTSFLQRLPLPSLYIQTVLWPVQVLRKFDFHASPTTMALAS